MKCETRPPCDEWNRFEVKLQKHHTIEEIDSDQENTRVPTKLPE